MSASQKLLIAGAAHAIRTRLEIAQRGRLYVFGNTVWGWCVWPLLIVLLMAGSDIHGKDWATYWHDFPHAASVGFKFLGFFLVVGLFRGAMRASAG